MRRLAGRIQSADRRTKRARIGYKPSGAAMGRSGIGSGAAGNGATGERGREDNDDLLPPLARGQGMAGLSALEGQGSLLQQADETGDYLPTISAEGGDLPRGGPGSTHLCRRPAAITVCRLVIYGVYYPAALGLSSRMARCVLVDALGRWRPAGGGVLPLAAGRPGVLPSARRAETSGPDKRGILCHMAFR